MVDDRVNGMVNVMANYRAQSDEMFNLPCEKPLIQQDLVLV